MIERELTNEQAAFATEIQRFGIPKVAVVKQDINEDLYCCPSGSSGRDVVGTTLLRTGPAALFSDWNAHFFMVHAVDDPECTIWQERATRLKWDTLEFFRSYQDRVPGRDYGQKSLAQPVESIDWSRFDLVISIDNSIPARVTQRYEQTLWAYYVREIKSPEYSASLQRLLPGQDLVLNHYFRPYPPVMAAHVMECPYHLQRYGCLQTIFGENLAQDSARVGVFVDHHTMVSLSPAEREQLSQFGPVCSTIHEDGREIVPTSERLARRTVDPDLRHRLFNARYFLCTPGHRHVFGTAIVEAIAAGCLVIGTPTRIGCGFVLSDATAAGSVIESCDRIRQLERRPDLRALELMRQRQLIDWVCYYRPLRQLIAHSQRRKLCRRRKQGRP